MTFVTSQGYPVLHATVAEAQEWIDAAEVESYCLSYNEASASDYVIVQA